MVNNLPIVQETQAQSLGQDNSPGEGNGYPLQCSCLENSMDRGAWRATVPGVTESDMTEQLTQILTTPRMVIEQSTMIYMRPA